MGVEIPTKYGGPGSSFFNSAIIVEEISKVDPAVAVLVDAQNTLVGPIKEFGSETQKQKYLTHMHKDWVCEDDCKRAEMYSCCSFLGRRLLPIRAREWIRRVRHEDYRQGRRQ